MWNIRLNQLTRRTLILERLEGRHLLSAVGIVDDLGSVLVCSEIPIQFGHFASNSAVGPQLAQGFSGKPEHNLSPKFGSLPWTSNALPLSSLHVDRLTPHATDKPTFNSSLDELHSNPLGAEGENQLDGIVAPTNSPVPSLGGRFLAETPASLLQMVGTRLELKDTIVPFGIYVENINQAKSTQTASNSANISHGGFIQLESLQRSDFDSNSSTSESDRSFYDESLSDGDFSLKLLSPTEDSEGSDSNSPDEPDGNVATGDESFPNAIELSSDASETDPVVEASHVVADAAAYDEAFIAEFGGLTPTVSEAAARDLVRLSVRDASPVIVVRDRDAYRVVDPIIGNAQAFEVIQARFDDPHPVSDDDQVGKTDFDSDDNSVGESKPELTEASVVSASVVFFAATRRRKKHEDNDELLSVQSKHRRYMPNSK